jgi:hypothetical protein
MIPAADLALARSSLVGVPGVIGVGYGLKETDGEVTGLPAWRVYVHEKRPPWRLREAERIPARIGALTTDVIAHAPTARASGGMPARPRSGAKIANARGVPGTLGCIAWLVEGGQPVLLSTWHVLFGHGGDEQSSVWLVEERDGARDFQEIGKTLHGKIGTVQIEAEEFYIDCAVASYRTAHRSLARLGFRPRLRQLFQLNGYATPIPGSRVQKTGSATQTTAGVVVDVCYPDIAFIEQRAYPAPRQVLVRPIHPRSVFCAEGDSGAALTNGEHQMVGLLWGTNSRGEGVACHIGPVLRTLHICLEKPPGNEWFIKAGGGFRRKRGE